jgi:hypothetical protein
MITKKCAMVLGIALVLVASIGLLTVRAGEIESARDIKKLADQVGKQKWDDLSRDGQVIGSTYSLLDVMTVFKKRKPGPGVGGIGVGDKPGANLPDGIEAKIISLSKRVSPADLNRAADLKRIAQIAAAVASVATHLPNENARATLADTMKWQKYAREMHENSLDLIKVLDGKDPAKVKSAALKLWGSCARCHADYR